MSATPSYPSVYIEGIPSGVRAMSNSALLDDTACIRCEAGEQACFHML